MSLQMQWIASVPASALAAAEAIADGRTFVEQSLAATLEQPARKLMNNIQRFSAPSHTPTSPSSGRGLKPALPATSNLSLQKVLQHLIPLSIEISGLLQLAEVSLMKVADRAIARDHASRLAELVRQMITAFQAAVPGGEDQLAVRSEPLQQQWEARGPGLMNQLGKLLEPDLIPTNVKVILIYPLLGGGGRAYLPYNSVRLESVLADVVPGLPEVLRLAWLIAQLNCDLAKYQGEMTRDELANVAALAMIPAVLAAAEELEMARPDLATIQLVLHSWPADRDAAEKDDPPNLAATLHDWWQTYQKNRPAWHVALAALTKMTRPVRSAPLD